MRTHTRRYFAVFFALLFICAVTAQAQNPPSSVTTSSTDFTTPGGLANGVHPLGSFGGSHFDNINLYNGNLSMSLPLGGYAGRGGMGASIVLSYNSKIWRAERRQTFNQNQVFSVPVYNHWDSGTNGIPLYAPGWTVHAGRMTARQSGWRDGEVMCGGVRQRVWGTTMTTMTFIAPDGTEYEFRDQATDGSPLPVNNCQGQSRGTVFHSTDGTSATFISNDPVTDSGLRFDRVKLTHPSGTVILRDGTRFRIDTGRVTKQTDRNGNIVRYIYDEFSSTLLQVMDNLGRSITLEYYVTGTDGTLDLIRVTTRGIGNAPRVVEVKGGTLKPALREDQTILPFSVLFPASEGFAPLQGDFEQNQQQFVTSVVLPSGHRWKFQYNSYGEVARVETPSHGLIEYDMGKGGGPDRIYNQYQEVGPPIFRFVKERRVYVAAGQLEGLTRYVPPTIPDGSINGDLTPAYERHYDAGGRLLAATRHIFQTAPFDNTITTGVPPHLGYKTWKEAKEFQTSELDTDAGETAKRVVSHTWSQRADVAWATQMGIPIDSQPSNDPRMPQTDSTWKDTLQTSTVKRVYDDYNNVTDEKVYDFSGILLREVARSYVNTLNGRFNQIDLDIHLKSLVDVETITGSRGFETRTKYEYDNYAATPDGFHAPLAFIQFNPPADGTHDSQYGTARIWRGNVTAVMAGFGTPDEARSYMQYDIAGNLVRSIGPATTGGKRLKVDISYGGFDGGVNYFAYPTNTVRVVTEADGTQQRLESVKVYDFSTGLATSETGYNGETTSYEYADLLDRATRVVRPGGFGETRFGYSAPTNMPKVTATVLWSGNATVSTAEYDGMLKPMRQSRSDGEGEVSVETRYDGLGRPTFVTNPHRGVQAETDGFTTPEYDALSRVTRVTSYDRFKKSTGAVTSQYKGNSVTVTDQAGKVRQSLTDALGRVGAVVEDPSLLVGPSLGLNYKTGYEYDSRGNLLSVNQGQERVFAYDALSRLVSARTPESGTVRYQYDEASNLVQRTDARSIGTQFSYDELNRLLSKSYSDGVTPAVSYFYDRTKLPGDVAPPGFSGGLSLGRLVGVVTDKTAGGDPMGMFHSYDIGGRIVSGGQVTEKTYFPTGMIYNEASLPTLETYPSGAQVARTYNLSGQTTSVTRNGALLAGGMTYAATGGLTGQTLGNGLVHQIGYNSRFQAVSISLGTGANPVEKLGLAYDYGLLPSADTPGVATNQGRNNGNVGRITITPGKGATPIEQDFIYDPLNRLSIAQEYAEPGLHIDSLDPASANQGTTVATFTVTGTSLSNAIALNFAPGTGITVTNRASTATTVTATLTIAANAPLISHAVSVTTPLGTSNSLPFTVTTGGGGGCLIGNITASGGGDAAPCFPSSVTSGASVCYGAVKGHSEGTVNFDVDVSQVPPTQQVIVTAGGGTLRMILPPSVTASLVVEIQANGAAVTSQTLQAVTDASGCIISTNGQPAGGCNAVGLESSVQTVSAPGGKPIRITYSFTGNSTAGPQGQFADLSFLGGPIEADCAPAKPGNSSKFQVPSSKSPAESKNSGQVFKTQHSAVAPAALMPSWRQEFVYDQYGNRTSLASGQRAGAMQVNKIAVSPANNRLSTPGVVYDPAGNLISDGSRTYTYDGENRLLTATFTTPPPPATGLVIKYVYDGEGRRMRKDVVTTTGSATKTVTTRFVYSPMGGLLAEYDGDPVKLPDVKTPTREDVYGPSGLLAVVEGKAVKYLTPDHLGSPRALTDASGGILSRRDFYPFGENLGAGVGGRTQAMGYDAQDKVRQGFTGYQHEDETGLDFAQARYYRNAAGRFNSVDLFYASGESENPQTWNRYTYCLNSPLVFTDPTGLSYIRNTNTGEIYYRDDIKSKEDLVKNGLDTSVYEVLTGEVFIDAAAARSLGLPGLEGHFVSFGDKSFTDLGLSNDYDIHLPYAQRVAIQIPTEREFLKVVGAFTLFNTVVGVTGGTGLYLFGTSTITTLNISNTATGIGANELINHACFVAGTKIATADGDVSIENIKVGDLVWAVNTQTGEKNLQKVVRTFRLSTEMLLTLKIDNETIETTVDHPFWVIGKGWVEGGKLAVGDKLQALDGKPISIEGIDYVKKHSIVYNIKVEGYHTYFVSNLKILVHNKADSINPADLTDKVGKIAKKFGRSEKDVREAIHAVKRNMPRGGPIKNPDVVVDLSNGEVYPKVPGGGRGDSIGNILDFLL